MAIDCSWMPYPDEEIYRIEAFLRSKRTKKNSVLRVTVETVRYHLDFEKFEQYSEFLARAH